jgi:hypothetical protein
MVVQRNGHPCVQTQSSTYLSARSHERSGVPGKKIETEDALLHHILDAAARIKENHNELI